MKNPLRYRVRLRDLNLRDLLVVGIPAAALIAGGFWLTAQFIRPAPPEFLVMSTGAPGGAYEAFAARYKPILAAHGIELRELSVRRCRREPAPAARPEGGGRRRTGAGRARLRHRHRRAGVARQLLSRAAVGLLSRRRRRSTSSSSCRGKRIAIGGGGQRHAQARARAARGERRAGERQAHAVPAARRARGGRGARDRARWTRSFSSDRRSRARCGARSTRRTSRLMSFAHADAYVRRFPFLSRLVLPRGGDRSRSATSPPPTSSWSRRWPRSSRARIRTRR